LWYNGGMGKDAVLQAPNRCISCAFLCSTPFSIDKFAEISNNTRKEILNKTSSLDLKCFKGLRTPGEIKSSISAELKCTNSQGWRLYREGLTPEMSFREEQNELEGKKFSWTKTGVVIATIGAIATLAVLALTIYTILFK
jgi:hypothetical protein